MSDKILREYRAKSSVPNGLAYSLAYTGLGNPSHIECPWDFGNYQFIIRLFIQFRVMFSWQASCRYGRSERWQTGLEPLRRGVACGGGSLNAFAKSLPTLFYTKLLNSNFPKLST